MNLNNWANWLKFSIALFSLILFLMGYLIANLTQDNSCEQDPLSYTVKGLNYANDADFICTCSDLSGKVTPFSYNEEGIIEENPLLGFLDS